MLDKKQIWVIFLSEFKMGLETTKTTHNINNTFGPGTAKEHTVQWWFKKFYEGDKRLEDEEPSGQPLEVDNNQARESSKLIFLQLHEKLPKTSSLTILWSFGIWSKLERWKSLVSGYLMSWLKIKKKKNHCFKVSPFLILCNNKPFLDWIVMCDAKWILYDNWQY